MTSTRNASVVSPAARPEAIRVRAEQPRALAVVGLRKATVERNKARNVNPHASGWSTRTIVSARVSEFDMVSTCKAFNTF